MRSWTLDIDSNCNQFLINLNRPPIDTYKQCWSLNKPHLGLRHHMPSSTKIEKISPCFNRPTAIIPASKTWPNLLISFHPPLIGSTSPSVCDADNITNALATDIWMWATYKFNYRHFLIFGFCPLPGSRTPQNVGAAVRCGQWARNKSKNEKGTLLMFHSLSYRFWTLFSRGGFHAWSSTICHRTTQWEMYDLRNETIGCGLLLFLCLWKTNSIDATTSIGVESLEAKNWSEELNKMSNVAQKSTIRKHKLSSASLQYLQCIHPSICSRPLLHPFGGKRKWYEMHPWNKLNCLF